MIDSSKVSFSDDFLGIAFDARWSTSFTSPGFRELSTSPSIGGWGRLAVTNSALGNARMRLGEDPGTGLFNLLNFAASKTTIAETIVFLNLATDVQATIGFIGLNDPTNVGGALLFSAPSFQWILQTVAGGNATTVNTGFTHIPGTAFKVRIELSTTAVNAYINGNLLAQITTNIPTTGLAWEYQVWNVVKSGGGFSSPSLWFDYFGIEQNR